MLVLRGQQKKSNERSEKAEQRGRLHLLIESCDLV